MFKFCNYSPTMQDIVVSYRLRRETGIQYTENSLTESGNHTGDISRIK